MADTNVVNEAVFEDVSFEEHTSTGGGEWETVPTSSYDFEIVGFKEVAKSDRKIQSDLVMKQKTHPETRLEDIDAYQWEWLLQIAEGEWAGVVLKDWTTRVFHENSRAGKIAAAAVGIDKYDVAVLRQYGGTRALMHKRVRCYVEEKEGTDGKLRNYLKVYSKIPEARQRPQRPQRTQADVQADVADLMERNTRRERTAPPPVQEDDGDLAF